MDISIFQRAYNAYGGGGIFSFVGDLLTARLGDYGAAVEAIELIACLPSRTRKFRLTLQEMFDEFHEYVTKLPRATFRRKLKRIEIIFLSQHFFAEDDDAWNPSAQKCNTAAEEVGEALPLLRKRIKPTDDFDAERFLADASAQLATKVDLLEEWESLKRQADEKRQGIIASKSPWELLEIDWSQYHPQAREILDDPFFWCCANDFAPHGNDTGADLMDDYRRWDRRHRTRSPLEFFDRLLKDWGIEPINWTLTQKDAVRRLNQDDPIGLSVCNESAIALVFAVLKMRAQCPADVIRMALASLIRTAILVHDSGLSDETKGAWGEVITKMRDKLESLEAAGNGMRTSSTE